MVPRRGWRKLPARSRSRWRGVETFATYPNTGTLYFLPCLSRPSLHPLGSFGAEECGSKRCVTRRNKPRWSHLVPSRWCRGVLSSMGSKARAEPRLMHVISNASRFMRIIATSLHDTCQVACRITVPRRRPWRAR